MTPQRDPQPLSNALSELIALRGFARVRGNTQLQAMWSDAAAEVAGPQAVRSSKATTVSRNVLQIAVGNAALLSELVSYHKTALLAYLQQKHPEMNIRDLKFRLQSGIGSNAGT